MTESSNGKMTMHTCLTEAWASITDFNPFHVPEWMEGCMWQMSCGMGKLIFIFKVTFLY